jgi:hypothetical protein
MRCLARGLGIAMRKLIVLLLLMALAPALRAEIYECLDASGIKRFTNIKAEAKGCKLLNVGPPNTVPPPPGVKAPGKPMATPSSFPKVDSDMQRQRDQDRRRILENELISEEKLLAQARQELTEQEAVRLGSERNYQRVLDRLEPYKKRVKLHEDNVASLKREMSGAR